MIGDVQARRADADRPVLCKVDRVLFGFERRTEVTGPQISRPAMNTIRTSLLAIVLFVTLSACDDDDPVGPGGNADVFAMTVDFFMEDASFNGPVASVQYDVPAITPRVVDEGAVLAYFREQGTWTAMPYTFGEESPDLPAVDYTVTLGFGYYDEFLEIFYEASSEDAVDLTAQPDQQVKVVIIDALPLAKAGVDLTDYDAVAEYFGLEN